jgi:hypothetical protein
MLFIQRGCDANCDAKGAYLEIVSASKHYYNVRHYCKVRVRSVVCANGLSEALRAPSAGPRRPGAFKSTLTPHHTGTAPPWHSPQ